MVPQETTRWIKRVAEYCPVEHVDLVPRGTRGIYVLFRRLGTSKRYDVVYVGLSRAGMHGRLNSHRKSKRKAAVWTHFSVFEVWPNVSESEIAELEGLFRHIYRRDGKANRLNVQKRYGPFGRKGVRIPDLRDWQASPNE